MRILSSFSKAIEWTGELMRTSAYEVRGTRWQSTDVSTKPEMRMKEILNHSFQVNLRSEDIEAYQRDIMPNLPWAEDHFLERICGQPLNPGVQWKNWPWAHSADGHRTAFKEPNEEPKFSHTYMERYWPKSANQAPNGHSFDYEEYLHENYSDHQGIRYKYGDLDDVVNHLLGDPLSRQAYLPVWFPEDTGVVHGARVPCSLGYHWILRNGYLHSTYYIRSCDFVRHFRDDLYLSIRLSIWLLDQLREREPFKGTEGSVQAALQRSDWQLVKLGFFTFHCVSMHCFVNDWNTMYAKVAV